MDLPREVRRLSVWTAVHPLTDVPSVSPVGRDQSGLIPWTSALQAQPAAHRGQCHHARGCLTVTENTSVCVVCEAGRLASGLAPGRGDVVSIAREKQVPGRHIFLFGDLATPQPPNPGHSVSERAPTSQGGSSPSGDCGTWGKGLCTPPSLRAAAGKKPPL